MKKLCVTLLMMLFPTFALALPFRLPVSWIDFLGDCMWKANRVVINGNDSYTICYVDANGDSLECVYLDISGAPTTSDAVSIELAFHYLPAKTTYTVTLYADAALRSVLYSGWFVPGLRTIKLNQTSSVNGAYVYSSLWRKK